MNITLTPEHARLVVAQVESGRFRDAEAVVMAALNSLTGNDSREAAVYPPGSLLHLYSPQANEAEARTANGSSLEVEAW